MSFEPQQTAVASFKPSSALGTTWGAGITLFSLAVGGGLIYKALQMDVRLEQLFPFVVGSFFLALAAVYAYWTWGCNSLSYIVDRNALSIRWGGVRQVVPLENIERLIPGSAGESPHIEGVNWPGHHIGIGTAEELGDIFFYSGHRGPEEVLYVQTPEGSYGISVPDPVAFAQVVQANQQRGPLFEQRQAVHRWGIAAQTFWLDRQAQLLACGLVLAFFVVLGYVLNMYPGLSQSVPLRFPSLGGIVRVSDKSELLDIPRSAAGFLALDLILAILLHTWERMVAYVLLLAGIAIQVMLLVAAVVAVA